MALLALVAAKNGYTLRRVLVEADYNMIGIPIRVFDVDPDEGVFRWLKVRRRFHGAIVGCLSLEDVAAMWAASKLIGCKPAGNTAKDCTGAGACDSTERPSSHADAATNPCAGARAGRSGYPACDETLGVVEVKRLLALGANDVGHRCVFVSFVRGQT